MLFRRAGRRQFVSWFQWFLTQLWMKYKCHVIEFELVCECFLICIYSIGKKTCDRKSRSRANRSTPSTSSSNLWDMQFLGTIMIQSVCVLFCFVIFNESESYISESRWSYPSKSTYHSRTDCALFFLSFEVALMNSGTPLHSNIIQGTPPPPIQNESVFCNELSMSPFFLSLPWVHDTYTELVC